MPITTYAASAALLLIAAWIVFRVFVRRDYRRSGRLGFVTSSLQFLVFCAWAYFAYASRPSHWPSLHVHYAMRVVGWTLFAGGMALTTVAMAALGLRRTLARQVDLLRQSGPYRVTRNPQVTAFGVGIVGYLVLWPSWPGLGAVAAYAAIAHVMVMTEEEHLRAAFGEQYRGYCERVPRYLGVPRIPRPAGPPG